MGRLLDLIFPRSCPGCGELAEFRGWKSAEPEALCPDCKAYWTDAEAELCGICSCPVSFCTCMPASMKRAKIAGFCKLVYYHTDRQEYVTNRVIYRLKNDSDAATVRYLAQELAEGVLRFTEEYGIPLDACVVTYLPRGRIAVLRSGRDQAKLLARALADRLDLPMVRAIGLRPFRGNRPRKQLNYSERKALVRKSFYLREQTMLRGKCVLAVDDIVATGAGMEVGADLLYRAGANTVLSVAVASDEINRSPRRKGSPREGAAGRRKTAQNAK